MSGSATSIIALPPVRIQPIPVLLRGTAFALSGGGAKGSFEVGVLKYLMRTAGIRPDILTCTSVGAVNGMKLAEGEGSPIIVDGNEHRRGLDGLEQTWLELRQDTDMYIPGPELAALPIDYQTSLMAVLSQGEQLAVNAALSTAGTGFLITAFLGPFALAFLGSNPASDLADALSAVVNANSLFTLDPVAARYDGGDIDPALVVESGIEVLLATVGLSSGALAYVRLAGRNARGRLVGDLVDAADVASPVPAVTSLSPPIDLKIGMLASAASPLFFAPQSLPGSGALGPDLYTDGGVRELVPIRAAIDRGANRVFGIDCNAAFPVGAPQYPHRFPGAPSGLLAIGPQVLGIMLDEVDNGDTQAPPPSQALVWHIRPLVEVHGDLEIDPGAIRVAIDYGELCGFDGADSSVRSSTRRNVLQQLGRTIAQLRRDVSDAERCLQWIVKLWNLPSAVLVPPPVTIFLLPFQPQDPRVVLLDALNYEPNGASVTGRYTNLMADLDLGYQFLQQAPIVGHYLDAIRSSSPPPSVSSAQALDWIRRMKCRIKPYYDGRVTMAGPRSVPPSQNATFATDAPWLRYEWAGITGADGSEPPESFFGPLWPDGPMCDQAVLDDNTSIDVFTNRMERNGTAGWAAQAIPGSMHVLVPDGETFTHVAGTFEAKSSTGQWLAAPHSTWKPIWQIWATSPSSLGAPVTWVTCCALPDAGDSSMHAVARLATPGGDTLVELTFEGINRTWSVRGPIALCAGPLIGVTGNPVLLQTTFGQEQSFELLVPIGDHVAHLYRHVDDAEWSPRASGVAYRSGSSGSGQFPQLAMTPFAVSCFQGNYGIPGNLEAVVSIGPMTGTGPTSLISLSFDAWQQRWELHGPIVPADGPIPAPTGDPFVFQSRIGTQGDFELLVPCGERVVHAHRQNDAGETWHRRSTGVVYDGGVQSGGEGMLTILPTPAAVTAIQSIDGTPETPNFDAIVRLRPIQISDASDSFESLWFDPLAATWSNAGTLEVNDQPVRSPA